MHINETLVTLIADGKELRNYLGEMFEDVQFKRDHR